MAEGEIRYIGLSAAGPVTLRCALAFHPVAALWAQVGQQERGCLTRADLHAELAEVIITAAVAISGADVVDGGALGSAEDAE